MTGYFDVKRIGVIISLEDIVSSLNILFHDLYQHIIIDHSKITYSSERYIS